MHVYFNGFLWFWFMVVFQRRLRSSSPAFSGNRRQCWCRANWVSFRQVRAWKSEWFCLEAKLPEGTMWFQESSVSALSLQIAVSSANYCQNQWNQLVFGSVCVFVSGRLLAEFLQRKHTVRVQGRTSWDHEVQICGADPRVHLPIQKSGQQLLTKLRTFLFVILNFLSWLVIHLA